MPLKYIVFLLYLQCILQHNFILFCTTFYTLCSYCTIFRMSPTCYFSTQCWNLLLYFGWTPDEIVCIKEISLTPKKHNNAEFRNTVHKIASISYWLKNSPLFPKDLPRVTEMIRHIFHVSGKKHLHFLKLFDSK